MAAISNEVLLEMKRDLRISISECTSRGLVHTANWAAQINAALPCPAAATPVPLVDEQDDAQFVLEYDQYLLGRACYNCKDFEQAAFFVKECTSNKCYFLKLYATFMAGNKKKEDKMSDMMSSSGQEALKYNYLRSLKMELSQKYPKLDGYCLYLYGVVLKELGLEQESMNILIESVKKLPILWATWIEIAQLCKTMQQVNSLDLPNHWMRLFFDAHIAVELQQYSEATRLYNDLLSAGLNKNSYVTSQLALIHYNMRDFNVAIEFFDDLHKADPFCLDHMDTYSNILYVKEMKPELSHLAHHCEEVDKYRQETCCVIGNYYSLRGCHEKAVIYFERALRLNPNCLSAWTLIGHEYMEMKNTSSAIDAYRKATEINDRDYRAWYGLGQTYEILKMPFYSLYYYRKAQKLRPNDSRMAVALGDCYQKVGHTHDAKMCFQKAVSVGDFDGTALLKLARLYENLNEELNAVKCYKNYVEKAEVIGVLSTEDISSAYKFLAHYYIQQKQLDEAENFAQKCCEYAETREDGKIFLRQLSELLSDAECTSTPVNRPSELLSLHSPDPKISPMNLTFSP